MKLGGLVALSLIMALAIIGCDDFSGRKGMTAAEATALASFKDSPIPSATTSPTRIPRQTATPLTTPTEPPAIQTTIVSKTPHATAMHPTKAVPTETPRPAQPLKPVPTSTPTAVPVPSESDEERLSRLVMLARHLLTSDEMGQDATIIQVELMPNPPESNPPLRSAIQVRFSEPTEHGDRYVVIGVEQPESQPEAGELCQSGEPVEIGEWGCTLRGKVLTVLDGLVLTVYTDDKNRAMDLLSKMVSKDSNQYQNGDLKAVATWGFRWDVPDVSRIPLTPRDLGREWMTDQIVITGTANGTSELNDIKGYRVQMTRYAPTPVPWRSMSMITEAFVGRSHDLIPEVSGKPVAPPDIGLDAQVVASIVDADNEVSTGIFRAFLANGVELGVTITAVGVSDEWQAALYREIAGAALRAMYQRALQ